MIADLDDIPDLVGSVGGSGVALSSFLVNFCHHYNIFD